MASKKKIKLCKKCGIKLTKHTAYGKDAKRLCSLCKSCYNEKCCVRWAKRKVEAIAKLGGKCNKCNNVYPYTIYEFHHVDPSKKSYSWNYMRLLTQSKLDKELAKCRLLCANCHRLEHTRNLLDQ